MMDRNRQFLHLDVHYLEYADLRLLPEAMCFDCVEYQMGWWIWNLPARHELTLTKLSDRGFSDAFINVIQFAWYTGVEAIHLSGLGDAVPSDKLWGDLLGGRRQGLELHVW